MEVVTGRQELKPGERGEKEEKSLKDLSLTDTMFYEEKINRGQGGNREGK